MTRKPSKKTRFLEQHPFCCFCGGGTGSEEIDHLPSRACFDNRHFPDGFEFPACRACNASTKDDEQVVALLSRAASRPDAAAIPHEIGRYVAGVANNSPSVFEAVARECGKANDGQAALLGPETDEAFVRVLTRWAKAFHYRETGVIVPVNSHLFVTYFTNANMQHVPAGALRGRRHELKRNGKDIGNQFAYVTKNDPDRNDIGYYTAGFRRSFLALMLVDFDGMIIRDDQAMKEPEKFGEPTPSAA